MTTLSHIQQGRQAIGQAVGGGVLALAGAVGLALLFFVTNSRDPDAQRLAFQLGLAGSAVLSALAQAMLFAGAWLMGRAAHRRER